MEHKSYNFTANKTIKFDIYPIKLCYIQVSGYVRYNATDNYTSISASLHPSPIPSNSMVVVRHYANPLTVGGIRSSIGFIEIPFHSIELDRPLYILLVALAEKLNLIVTVFFNRVK